MFDQHALHPDLGVYFILHWDKINMNENPIFLLRSKKSFLKREICIVLLPFETSYLSCLI